MNVIHNSWFVIAKISITFKTQLKANNMFIRICMFNALFGLIDNKVPIHDQSMMAMLCITR